MTIVIGFIVHALICAAAIVASGFVVSAAISAAASKLDKKDAPKED